MSFKIVIYLVCISVCLLLFPNKSIAQPDDNSEYEMIVRPDLVYWYFINVTIRPNPKKKTDSYYIKLTRVFVNEGDEKGFTKSLWSEIKDQKLAIGPFWDYNQAQLAMEFYNVVSRKKPPRIPYDADATVYWYYLTIETKRGGYKLNALQGKISEGNIEQFASALASGLEQGMLAVGPFYFKYEVEDSLRILSK